MDQQRFITEVIPITVAQTTIPWIVIDILLEVDTPLCLVLGQIKGMMRLTQLEVISLATFLLQAHSALDLGIYHLQLPPLTQTITIMHP